MKKSKYYLNYFILGTSNITPDWNFYKYLVGPDGQVLRVYKPQEGLDALIGDIRREVEDAMYQGREDL